MSKKQNFCVDCGVEISRQAIRCHSCATKACWKRKDYRQGQWEAMKAAWKRGAYSGSSEAMKAAWARGDMDGISEALKAAWERGDFDGVFTEEVRQKRSEALRASWERGDRGDDEYRRKLAKAAKAAWARGDMNGIFNEEFRQKQSEAMKRRWARGDFDSAFQSPTSIELQVAAALDIMGIEHTSQFRPNGCSRIFDEFIPPNTLLEVQGDYWHGDERPKQQKRDTEKAQWAKENGFELIGIWEHEIKEQGAWAIIAQTFTR